MKCFVKSGIQQYSDMSLQIGVPIEREALLKIFRTDISRGYIGRIFNNNLVSHWDLVGQYLTENQILIQLDEKGKKIYTDLSYFRLNADDQNLLLNELQGINVKNPFDGYKFLHLQADRDIKTEPIDFNQNTFFDFIKADASNITSLIARMINDEGGIKQHWKEYIERDFLENLNKIVAPEIIFTRIYTMVNGSGRHEIYLEEANKGGIKLSDCGSGLKTIIATLTLLHIIPSITIGSKFVFAFEELENNMHPRLER